jgi:hypothetical protein
VLALYCESASTKNRPPALHCVGATPIRHPDVATIPVAHTVILRSHILGDWESRVLLRRKHMAPVHRIWEIGQ